MNMLFEDPPTVAQHTNNEWYTPIRYIEAACNVMGSIELDPASCAFANESVKASRYYTQAENGLMLPWCAKTVWLNPPYGRTSLGNGSNLEQFTRHLIEQYRCGNTQEAILLIPVNTTTSWFVPLWDYPICFPVGRICFYNEHGVQNNVSFGTCFVYFGPNTSRFCEVFGLFGSIVGRIFPAATVAQSTFWSEVSL